MEVEFSKKAEKELDKMDNSFEEIFIKHSENMATNPSKKHMKHGLPFHAKKITKQARIVFKMEKNILHVLHCFKTHKEYERWYSSL